jgi:uncharacterized protein YprB with RNaseH-like and TPR domain
VRVENSFIGAEGVGEVTERRLWEAGVTHWDEFRPDRVGETRAARIEAHLCEARERLDADDAAFFDRAFPAGESWRLWDTFREEAACFDIETTGLSQHRDRVTTVSVHRDGDTETLVAGDDLTVDNLRAAFGDATLLVTFNGARFDVPFLESSFDVDLDFPHLDLVYPCRRLDLTGGLKAIERAVGIERDRPDISGRDAVRLWREHERGRDGSLETLISYNREDAVNLAGLADRVVDRLEPTPLAGT